MSTINYIEEIAKKAFSLFGLSVRCSYNEPSSKMKNTSKNANEPVLTPDACDYRARSAFRKVHAP